MAPKYAERFARLPRVLQLLAEHPGGLALDALADLVGSKPDELREDLLAFYTADLVEGSALLGLSRPETIEFISPDGAEADPHLAEVVRVSTDRPTEELGVELVDAAEIALLYTAAKDLQDLEPGNDDLASAVAELERTLKGVPSDEAAAPRTHRVFDASLEALKQGIAEQRCVRIVYSRAWDPGVSERIIHPYRLQRTRARGWEVDAGPADEHGALRTFILSNVRDFELLDDSFELPEDLPAMLDRQRRTRTVRASIPHAGRWAADRYAERVHVVEDRETLVLDLEVLEPASERVGLLLLSAGDASRVVAPPDLRDAAIDHARQLLRLWASHEDAS